MLTFMECAPSAPTLFRYIVMEESCWTCPLMIAVKKMYVAVAMEWHQLAQGESVEDAVDSLEQLLMGNAAMMLRNPKHNPEPSPEDYQRVATSGQSYICADPKWRLHFGEAGTPIVARGVIDMAKSGMRIVPSEPKP